MNDIRLLETMQVKIQYSNIFKILKERKKVNQDFKNSISSENIFQNEGEKWDLWNDKVRSSIEFPAK